MERQAVNPIALIGGTGRSGSTVLRQMFARHPSVATLPTEARFLTDPDGIVDFHAAMQAGWSPYLFDVKVKRLRNMLDAIGSTPALGRVLRRGASGGLPPAPTPRGPGGGRLRRLRSLVGDSALVRFRPRYWSVSLTEACPDWPRLVDELLQGLVEFRFSGRWTGMPLGEASSIWFGPPNVTRHLQTFCRGVVACICEQRGATHLVEDTPFNLLAFDGIQRLLPESRLVHIHRDPRDVVASYLQKRWSPSDARLAARYYATMIDRWDRIRPSLPDGSLLEISLRDLVDATEQTVRGICEFWGLDWDPVVLEIDLSRSNTGRWQTDIPTADLAAVEEILAPYVERYAATP